MLNVKEQSIENGDDKGDESMGRRDKVETSESRSVGRDVGGSGLRGGLRSRVGNPNPRGHEGREDPRNSRKGSPRGGQRADCP